MVCFSCCSQYQASLTRTHSYAVYRKKMKFSFKPCALLLGNSTVSHWWLSLCRWAEHRQPGVGWNPSCLEPCHVYDVQRAQGCVGMLWWRGLLPTSSVSHRASHRHTDKAWLGSPSTRQPGLSAPPHHKPHSSDWQHVYYNSRWTT